MRKKKRNQTAAAVAEPEEHTGDSIGDVDEQLSAMFDDSWGNSQPKEFVDVPNGTYQTRIIAAFVNNAKSSGRLQCTWEMVILDGEQRARHLFKHDGLDNEDSIGYFKGTLSTLGYDEPADSDALKATLAEIVEAPTYAVARVSSKKRKVDGEMVTRSNTRIIRALDSDDVTDDLEEEDLASFIQDYDPAEEMEPAASEEDLADGDIVYEKGDRVTKDFDGEAYAGTITRMKGDSATIKFDDGETLTVSVDELSPEDPAAIDDGDGEAGESGNIVYEKGDRVTKDFDGETYAGVITRMKGEDQATVKFDDDEVATVDVSELSPEENDDPDADAGEPEPEPDADDPDAAVQEPETSLKKGVKVTAAQEKVLDKLARKLGFNPDDYPTWEGLLCELGDYCGLSGEFSVVNGLIKQIQEASA